MIENTKAKATIWNSNTSTTITTIINQTGLIPQHRLEGTHYVVQADLKLSNFPSFMLGLQVSASSTSYTLNWEV